MILVAGLVGMIVVGLLFRSACIRLTSKKTRRELMRRGLRQMGSNMDTVTRAMSSELVSGDSPQAVIRTYSNYRERERKEGKDLRLVAIINSFETENKLTKQEKIGKHDESS